MALNTIILAVGMLLAGSFNTIATKYQDATVVGHDEETGKPILFLHPAAQTAIMFAGETLCLIPYFISRWHKSRTNTDPNYLSLEDKAAAATRFRKTVVAFAIPAMCDATATTLLNLGLFYTYASVFQMLRGTLVIFAGLLTIIMLKRRLHSHNWIGMSLIAAGAALVGASSILFDREKDRDCGDQQTCAPNPLLGDMLVICAQFLNAAQFIIEEKFLSQYQAPVLLAVGSEGLFGVLLSILALPLISNIKGPSGQPLDSGTEAFKQIASNPRLQWTTICTVLSIALFNFCGVSVTKRLSGAARAAIDACRTAIIFGMCVYLGWEKFHFMQLVGFTVLITGTSVYNDILRSCLPAPEPHYHSHHHHHRHRHHAVQNNGSSDVDVEQPLLGNAADTNAEINGAATAVSPTNARAQNRRSEAVTFADPPPQILPLRAPRSTAAGRRDYSMARSVTLLPGALSPHSISSVPNSAATWQLASSASSASSLDDDDRSSGSYSSSEKGDNIEQGDGGGGGGGAEGTRI